MSLETLKTLCALDGTSGRESTVRDYLYERLQESPAQTEIALSPMGNLIVRVRGHKRPARTLMFDAHMDEVGVIVTGLAADGTLRFAAVGGIDPKVLFGRRVRINGHVGVIGGKAFHQCTEEERGKVPSVDAMRIDLGTDSREESAALVSVGDTGVFDSDFVPLYGSRFKAKALDDRAGCALLLRLTEEIPEYDMVLSFSVQEEIGCRGAKTAAYTVKPDVAVVIDSTTASDTAGVPEGKEVCRVGQGPVVSFMDRATLYDKELFDRVMATAAREGIPAQPKTRVAGGNNASAIQQAGEGCLVTAVSLPCRYIHSASSVLDEADVENTFRLLKALIGELAR